MLIRHGGASVRDVTLRGTAVRARVCVAVLVTSDINIHTHITRGCRYSFFWSWRTPHPAPRDRKKHAHTQHK